jgi:hypothetical protein
MTHRIVTVFSDIDYKKIQQYAKKKGLSLFTLAKTAIREFMEKHP